MDLLWVITCVMLVRIYERVLSYRVSSILSCIDVNFGSNSVSRMLVLGLKIQRGYER